MRRSSWSWPPSPWAWKVSYWSARSSTSASPLGLTELFIGVIVIAIIGNAAEHSTAILMAMKNKMDLSLSIAMGSSTQIAMLIAPVLVFISWLMGTPMNLVFNEFEVVAVIAAVVIANMVSADGESNWLEGVQMIALYVMMAVVFFFIK